MGGLDDLHLVHHSLPEAALNEVDLHTHLSGVQLAWPLYLNAMTGGAHETEAINRDLATACRELGLAMAVGSQTAALQDPAVVESYRVVRRTNPAGVVIANVGAGSPPERALTAVEMLEANLLQLHLNAPQELQMAEGDRDFRGQLAAIARVVERSPVPVLVKECGFGLSRRAARSLYDAGVRLVDVAGHGGTNFAWIEAARRVGYTPDPGLVQWGIPTAASLLEVLSLELPGLQVVASGGLRGGVDAARALAVGAAAVAVAGPALRARAAGGVSGLLAYLEQCLHDLQVATLLTGAHNLNELQGMPVVIRGETRAWCAARGIDVTRWGSRDLGV